MEWGREGRGAKSSWKERDKTNLQSFLDATPSPKTIILQDVERGGPWVKLAGKKNTASTGKRSGSFISLTLFLRKK